MPNVNNASYTPNNVPNLIPDLDAPFVAGLVCGLQTSINVLATANGARAVGAITVSGAGGTGDILPFSVRGVALSVTVGATLTVTAVALLVVAAINTSPALANVVSATAVAGVVTIVATSPGIGGNSLTLAIGTPAGTVAANVSTAMASGTGVITPLETFSLVVGKSIYSFDANRPISVSAPVVAAIVASGRAFK